MDFSIRQKTLAELEAEKEAELIAADLLNDQDKAGKAYRAQERNAMRLQMDDRTGAFA